ncbi:hypothetical protein W04_0621 [Pseudoalteromonas sp. SW0106-04]|nr:hypothetical protein W04_0621 [Pseudoalteromonas sp. SW0106-04]
MVLIRWESLSNIVEFAHKKSAMWLHWRFLVLTLHAARALKEP